MCNKANEEIKQNNKIIIMTIINSMSSKEGRKRRVLKNRCYKQKTNSQRVDLKLIMPVITSNANVLNAPIKKQNLSDWIKKNKT